MKCTDQKVLYFDDVRKTAIYTFDGTFKAFFKAGIFDVEALSRIRNAKPPHILKLLRFDETTMLTEFVEGESLMTARLGKEQLYNVILQICDGVSALHSLGVLHLDIMTSNIMISRGNVTIVDLESSRCAENGYVTDNIYAGNRFFSAPELLRGDAVDNRADIFSLGCTIADIMRMNKGGNALADIATKCQTTEPRHRYDSVESLKKDIIKAVRLEGVVYIG